MVPPSPPLRSASNESPPGGDLEALVPTTSAAFVVTTSQNVAREVQERVDGIRGGTKRAGVGTLAFFLATAAGVAAAIAGGDAGVIAIAAILGIYGGGVGTAAGLATFAYRRRALGQAELLNRDHDVAWVSPRDGLVFFSDEGVHIERRGGYRPYGVGSRRFRRARLQAAGRARAVLTLEGYDSLTGATYDVDIGVPAGFTDGDTARVQAKLDAFVLG